MEATKTSSPILSSDLYSKLVNSAIKSLELYVNVNGYKSVGKHISTIPIRYKRNQVARDLGYEYRDELTKIPRTDSDPARKRFRSTLRDIVEAAAMRLGYERGIVNNQTMWVK